MGSIENNRTSRTTGVLDVHNKLLRVLDVHNNEFKEALRAAVKYGKVAIKETGSVAISFTLRFDLKEARILEQQLIELKELQGNCGNTIDCDNDSSYQEAVGQGNIRKQIEVLKRLLATAAQAKKAAAEVKKQLQKAIADNMQKHKKAREATAAQA